MRWFKRDWWNVAIALTGLVLFLSLMIGVPMSVSAHEGVSEVATLETVQVTPTVDLTVTVLAKEQLALQVKQLQNQLQDQNNWLSNNSTALIAAVATVIVALFGISQWVINRRDERRKEVAVQDKELKDCKEAQDKELRAQAEERFKTAVTALGNENEGTQVGGAILLRSFLNQDDRKIYERYYTQIFDLAISYLRMPSQYQSADSPYVPLPLTPIRQALIIVFKEAFPLARAILGPVEPSLDAHSLDASGVRLDGAFLVWSDMSCIWMIHASLVNARLLKANLYKADLRRANLHKAHLPSVVLTGANLFGANLSETNLCEAYLNDATLTSADLSKANLKEATLVGACLSGVKFNGAILAHADLLNAEFGESTNLGEHIAAANPEDAASLDHTDLRGAQGLTKTQLAACKAKGAIIDEDTTTNLRSVAAPPSVPSQTTATQSSSTVPVQVHTPISTNGNNATSS